MLETVLLVVIITLILYPDAALDMHNFFYKKWDDLVDWWKYH